MKGLVMIPKRSAAAGDTVVDEIVARVSAYKHHPRFRRAVVQAKNLVKHYLADHNRTRLGAHDQDLVERIACAIHAARIERDY